MFCNTPKGAYASAGIYSLIETAKANDLNPFDYLNYLFNKLPDANSKNELLNLLPTKINSEELSSIN